MSLSKEQIKYTVAAATALAIGYGVYSYMYKSSDGAKEESKED
jgi:hypothetical protein